MVVPENVALAAYRRDPEDRGVVEAWVESGGDANGRWDAADQIFLQFKMTGGALLEPAQRQWCSRSWIG